MLETYRYILIHTDTYKYIQIHTNTVTQPITWMTFTLKRKRTLLPCTHPKEHLMTMLRGGVVVGTRCAGMPCQTGLKQHTRPKHALYASN